MLGLVLSIATGLWIIACILAFRHKQSNLSELQKEIVPIFLENTPEEARNETTESPHARECPFCRELIKDTAVKCPHCGESIGRHYLYAKKKYSKWSIYRVERFFEQFLIWAKNLAFFEVLDYASRLSILIAIIFWFHDAPERDRQNKIQAWQVISAGQQIGGGPSTVQAFELLNCIDLWFCTKVSFEGIKLERVDLPSLNLSGAMLKRVILNRSNLMLANLEEANLQGADLQATSLAGANLTASDLQGADLQSANLVGANLQYVNLAGAHLAGANLYGAFLQGSNLQGADMQGVDLQHANLYGVILDNANLWSAIYDSKTKWPEGFTPPPTAIKVD